MRLHYDDASTPIRVSGYSGDYVQINETRYERSLILFPDAVVPNWRPGSFAALERTDMDAILRETNRPSIVLLGTGRQQRFPAADLLQVLYQNGIGVEIMDTQAACRTFNLLAAEDRNVAAALILETDAEP